MSEHRITNILNGAARRERFLRIHTESGVIKYEADAIGAASAGKSCTNGVVVENLGADTYNVFMTTIDNGEVVMFMHACVNANGMIKGRYTYNAFGLGFRSSNDQAYIDEILAAIVGWEHDDVINDYWDLVNGEPSPHTCTDSECLVCAARECPFEEPLHLHHDGCLSCYEFANRAQTGES